MQLFDSSLPAEQPSTDLPSPSIAFHQVQLFDSSLPAEEEASGGSEGSPTPKGARCAAAGSSKSLKGSGGSSRRLPKAEQNGKAAAASAPPPPPPGPPKPIATADLRLSEDSNGIEEAQLPYHVPNGRGGRKLKIVTVRVASSVEPLPDLPESRLSRTGVLLPRED